MRLKINLSQIVTAFLFVFGVYVVAKAQTLAPGAPGKDAQWASAGKQAIGTSANLESKIWFTLQGGALTDVYYPDVTVANVHLLQFVVVNPKTKKVETERDDAIHKIKVLRSDSLSFQQINTAKSGEWTITKSYATNPSGNALWIDVQFQTKSPELRLYAFYDPSLKNTGLHDTASILQLKRRGVSITSDGNSVNTSENVVSEENGGSVISSTDKDISSLLLFLNTEIEELSSGFYGVSDGLSQLRMHGELKERYEIAKDGNVVQIARILNPQRFTAILSFGKDLADAFKQINPTDEELNFQVIQAKYEKGWSDYVKTLPKVEPKYQAQFNMAAMVIKAQEDKTVRGANVASLTIPWGGGLTANEDVGGGYHLVWSRDLYQVVTAYMALGDTAAANRALDFLFKIQQKPDGSFPQNSWLDGRPSWNSLQLDEVAYPLILAYQLKRFDRDTYQKHVKKAADFIVKTGPKTVQERWEEKSGYSPSTIAAEIAGLVCAAEIAKKNDDNASATTYLATADDWARNVERWTVTTKGVYGDGNYYLRLTENGTPDAGEKTVLNNSAGTFLETEIVDAGFLELVRLGIKSPDDPLIVKSVKIIDEQLKVKTPNGEVFYRYNHDGYGEMDDGRRWNWDGKYTGKGRPWPLLTGERGQYELAMAESKSQSPKSKVQSQEFLTKAKTRLDAMLNFANEGLMIPEQVWDKAETPASIDKQFVSELKFGEGTGSATPLAWSMAQFIRLAINLQVGRNLETPDVVYNRYVLKGTAAKTSLNRNAILIKEAKEMATPADIQCFKQMGNHQSYAKIAVFPQFRRCQNGMSYAVFAFRGDAQDVQIVGDFTDWQPRNWKLSVDESGAAKDTTKYASFPFSSSARVEYKFIIDGKWILDPLNPNKVDNGVGGENSFFTMPAYKSTVWNKKESRVSQLETLEINSKIYGRRAVKIYVPSSQPQFSATAEGSDKMPTLYLQDGSDYVSRASAIQIQQNLVKAGKLKPFIMVFIDPKDRMKEYWANDDYAKFLATEVVPAIDAKYDTIKSSDGRAILGASLGGVTSVHAALKYPETFRRVGGQSSSFWIDDERVVKDLAKLDSVKTPYRFYFDVGTLEGAEDDRRVHLMLRDKGFPVVYEEAAAGHNWTAWRDRLATAFVALWK